MKDYADFDLAKLTETAMRERAELLSSHVRQTPSVAFTSPRIDPLLGGGELVLKLEQLQVTGTFKARGALSVALEIPLADRPKGITAASAGNHAIAAAWAAGHIGVSAKVVMISTANPFRVERAKMLGAEVVIVEGGGAAMAAAQRLSEEGGRTYIHPFEGPYTTLGAAGVGLEMADQIGTLEAGKFDLNDSYVLALRDLSNPIYRYKDPFGKAGAGAPVRDRQGNSVVTRMPQEEQQF